jgi:uncharacterized protein (DUF1501 family)
MISPWDRIQIDYDAWDTHRRNFPILRENKLPGLDQTYTALMEDLSSRGLLDETLVVTMSEMGRTPRINGNGGRDHWTFCYSVMFAGAGIKGGLSAAPPTPRRLMSRIAPSAQRTFARRSTSVSGSTPT